MVRGYVPSRAGRGDSEAVNAVARRPAGPEQREVRHPPVSIGSHHSLPVGAGPKRAAPLLTRIINTCGRIWSIQVHEVLQHSVIVSSWQISRYISSCTSRVFCFVPTDALGKILFSATLE